MKKNNLILLLLAFFLFGIAISTLTFSYYYVYDVQHIPLSYEVSDTGMGVLLDNKSLAMGRVSPGGGSMKKFSVSTPIPTRFQIYSNNPSASNIYFTPSSGDLQPNEPVTIKVALSIPEDEPLGTYNGIVTVRLFRR